MQCYIMHASFKLISLAVLEIQHTAAFDSRYLIKEKSVIEPKIIFGLISLELPRDTHLLMMFCKCQSECLENININ